MKNLFTFAALALLGLTTLQSCADDPVAPSESETMITFTQNAEAKYNYTRLDTAAGNYNNPMADGRDTVKQKTIATNQSYQGKTGVVFRENTYVLAGMKDSTYLYQEANGDLYVHNFGLDLVNGPDVQAVLNQQISAGWVLVGKMAAAQNATWTAVNLDVQLINLGFTATIKDVVTANGNADIQVNGQTVKTKKFTHVVTATVPLFGQAAKTEFELYISAANGGIVKQVRKVSDITLPSAPPTKAVGADLHLVSYVK